MFHMERGPKTVQPSSAARRQSVMALIWWVLVGVIAGGLAKALVPGDNREPKGCLLTMALGIAGSVLTGLVLHYLLGWQTGGHFIGTIIGATIGAVVLILLFRKLWK
jgi:uncharacterized membrane protein YeaQ/YmgE (transglycosylase-associated protein family)